MTDQSTPVTDDDRKAHEWASSPARQSNGLLAPVARAILAHVPAPPAALADELREWGARPFDGLNWTGFHDLADRVEAVEKELAGHKRDYAECQQELIESERKCFSADLPEPSGYNAGLPWWGACDTEVRPAGYEQRVICTDENGPWEATAQDVREFAYALLAAADWAEEHIHG